MIKRTPSFRQAPNVYNVTIIDFVIDACETHLSTESLYLLLTTSRETSLLVFFDHEKRERKSVLRPRVCATARTPKTPVFGLPKSRPSPLQKTPFFALSEAKSVHF